jgi:hypothetical protein
MAGKGDPAEIERKSKTTLSSCSSSASFLNLYASLPICGYIRGRNFAGRTSLKPRSQFPFMIPPFLEVIVELQSKVVYPVSHHWTQDI